MQDITPGEDTSRSIQSVDQSPCFHNLLFSDRDSRGPFRSAFELWEAISLSLHNPHKRIFPNQALEALKKRLPKCEPYVLTHCDLNLGNLLVKDSALAGILGWELAAYYPVWYEYVSASGDRPRRMLGKKLLQKHFSVHSNSHHDAKKFWRDLREMRKYPNLDANGQEVLEGLL